MIVCKELIITDLARKGSGENESSPVRAITQVYDKSGQLIAEYDPNGCFSIEDMISFAKFYSFKKGTIQDWMLC